jgi:hypothetical protein
VGAVRIERVMAPPRDRSPVPVRIGPAGWSYQDWEGVVFSRPKPRGFDPLEYLSPSSKTVEINSTFCQPARAEVAEKWAARVEAHPALPLLGEAVGPIHP